jgi:hypothetical protein
MQGVLEFFLIVWKVKVLSVEKYKSYEPQRRNAAARGTLRRAQRIKTLCVFVVQNGYVLKDA